MMRSVQAAVLAKPRTLELREFPLPAIGPDEALLEIEACGICGTDYEQCEGDVPPFPIEQAEQAILTLSGAMPGLNAIHIAIAPGAPPVPVVPKGS